MIEEEEMARLLRAEAEAGEAPSAILSIERAMTTGRRQRWYGRGAGAALLVGALVAGVATVPSLVRSEPPSTAYRFAAEVPTADPSQIPAALEVVDPTIGYVRFGWLPSGFRTLFYQAGLLTTQPGVQLIADNADQRYVVVSLYPKGVSPAAPQRDNAVPATVISTTAAPDIRGTAATFTTFTGAERDEVLLRWQYAPDGWAQVRVFGGEAGVDVRESAVRVAQTLRFSTTARVPLPARINGLPTDLRPLTITVHEQLGTPRSWEVSLEYTRAPVTAAFDQWRSDTLRLGFRPYTGVWNDSTKQNYSPPNTTVDGHQACLQADPSFPTESLVVYDTAGMTISVSADSSVGADGTRGLYRQLDLIDNSAGWHTHLVD